MVLSWIRLPRVRAVLLEPPCGTASAARSILVTAWCDRTHADSQHIQDHQACAYGSLRPKWTRLVANFLQVHRINLTCPGNHQHEAWGVQKRGNKRVFATSLEVHYPTGLGEAIANAVASRLLQQGFVPMPVNNSNKQAQVFSGIQPASSKIPAFIPEHKTRFACVCERDAILWPAECPTTTAFKLLHTEEMGMNDNESLANFSLRLREACARLGAAAQVNLDSAMQLDITCALKIFGIPWTPEEFVDEAKQLVHPLAPELALPAVLRETLEQNRTSSFAHLAGPSSSQNGLPRQVNLPRRRRN